MCLCPALCSVALIFLEGPPDLPPGSYILGNFVLSLALPGLGWVPVTDYLNLSGTISGSCHWHYPSSAQTLKDGILLVRTLPCLCNGEPWFLACPPLWSSPAGAALWHEVSYGYQNTWLNNFQNNFPSEDSGSTKMMFSLGTSWLLCIFDGNQAGRAASLLLLACQLASWWVNGQPAHLTGLQGVHGCQGCPSTLLPTWQTAPITWLLG